MSYGMMNCPYCEHEMREPDEHPGEDQVLEEECSKCEKHFIARMRISIDYDTEKMPCLNGEPHDWRERKYAFWKNKQQWQCWNCERNEWREIVKENE